MKILLRNLTALDKAKGHYRAALIINRKNIGIVELHSEGAQLQFAGDTEAYRKADEWCITNLPAVGMNPETNQPYEHTLAIECGLILRSLLYPTELTPADLIL